MADVWPLIVFMVLIFVMFYFLMIRPQRRRQKEHEEMIQSLKRGDRIITAGGIYGQIESVSKEGDSVLIKVDSGATIRIATGSIASKQER